MRVLQLIGDTDAIAEHRAAVELHRSLSAVGLEVRTLALAPGSTGRARGARSGGCACPHLTGGADPGDPGTALGRRRGPARLAGAGPRHAASPTGATSHGHRGASHIAGGGTAGRGGPSGEAAGGETAGGPIARGADALRRRVVTAASVLVVDAPGRVAGTARGWNRPADEVVVAADPAGWAEVLSGVVRSGGRCALSPVPPRRPVRSPGCPAARSVASCSPWSRPCCSSSQGASPPSEVSPASSPTDRTPRPGTVPCPSSPTAVSCRRGCWSTPS